MKTKNRKPIYISAPFAIHKFFTGKNTLVAISATILLVLMGAVITEIPPTAAIIEHNYAAVTSDIEAIGSNPLYLPHKLLSYLALQISPNIRSIRIISVLFYAMFVFALFKIIRRWHNERIAYGVTFLFATNSTILAAARLASPFIILLSWVVVISLLLWIRQGTSKVIAPITLFVMSALLFFIPGAPYFAVLVLFLYGRKLFLACSRVSKPTLALSSLIGILLISVLGFSIYRDTSILNHWLLLPKEFDLEIAGRNILRIPSAFIYRSPISPLTNIGRIPLLDVVSGGMMLIGLYAYRKNGFQERGRLMILTTILAVILGALGQVLSAVLIALPFAYTMIAAGLGFLHDQWEDVFPKNPVARTFGTVVLSLMVAASAYNQLTRFLVVWPNTPETRQIYSEPSLIQ